MNSGMHGSKNELGDCLNPAVLKKSEEEIHFTKLLSLISDKIKERFVNLRSCFRFLDTNHSGSISINEFAQAIEHMRLKISFEDIKKIFDYIDKNHTNSICYNEFTLLLEENWRGIQQPNLAESLSRVSSSRATKFRAPN